MRKTLPLIEKQLFELFANFKYKLPKDPELMLYDFYFLTAFGNTIKTRNIDADYAVEEATDDIVEAMHHHMIKAVFFALCAEIRHLFDMARLHRLDGDASPKDVQFMQEYYKEYAFNTGASTNVMNNLMMDNPLAISPRDRKLLSMNDNSGRLASYNAVKSAMKKFGWGRYEFAKFCERMFLLEIWRNSYGGKPWAGIAKALWKLETAKKKLDKIIWIDHAYDLQHNTDTVFNKLRIYMKDNSYSWIKKALDWKRDADDMTDYYKRCSPQLRPLIAYISKNVYGKTIQGNQPGPVPAQSQAPSFPLGHNGPTQNSDFAIGDLVSVVDSGDSIPNYSNIGDNFNNWTKGATPSESPGYKVISSFTLDGPALVIRKISNKKVYLIYTSGVEKYGSGSGAGLTISPEMRSDNSSSYKFMPGDKVKITSTSAILSVDNNVWKWGQENGLNISTSDILPNTTYQVLKTAENDYYPDKIIVLVKPVDADEVYLIEQSGLTEAEPVMGLAAFDDPEPRYIDISNLSNNWTNVRIKTRTYELAKSKIKKFQWLLDATIEDADLTIDKYNNVVWKKGTWRNGVWRNGVWETGTWRNGVWKTGTWKTGTWNDGVWKNGTWKDGVWYNGTWKTGTWKNGKWWSGTWEAGTWKNGDWVMGEIVGPDGIALYSTEAPGA